ncbi:MAG: hypothetical protein JKY11_03925 [Alphaproteobacteria bacterium]|nr:hypothetical protein [Alphaproteobacteria bacterium]
MHIEITDTNDAIHLNDSSILAVIYNDASFVDAASYFLDKSEDIDYPQTVSFLSQYRYKSQFMPRGVSRLNVDFFEHAKNMEVKAREIYKTLDSRAPMMSIPFNPVGKVDRAKGMHVDTGFKYRVVGNALGDKSTEFVKGRLSRTQYDILHGLPFGEQDDYLNALGVDVGMIKAGQIIAFKGSRGLSDTWSENLQIHRAATLNENETRFGLLFG